MNKDNHLSSQTGGYEPAIKRQVGGDHYKLMVIQPIEYIVKNDIGFAEGNVIKYVSRWKNKNGIADLKKAMHILELLIDLEEDKMDIEEDKIKG